MRNTYTRRRDLSARCKCGCPLDGRQRQCEDCKLKAYRSSRSYTRERPRCVSCGLEYLFADSTHDGKCSVCIRAELEQAEPAKPKRRPRGEPSGRWPEPREVQAGVQLATPPPGCITGVHYTSLPQVTQATTGLRTLVDCYDFTVKVPPGAPGDWPRWAAEHLLGIPWQAFEERKGGGRKYRRSAFWGEIKVFWDGSVPGMGVHVQVQGVACRQLDAVYGHQNGWVELFKRVDRAGGKGSRLDLAIDDISVPDEVTGELLPGYLDMHKMARCRRTLTDRWVQDGMGYWLRPTLIRSPCDKWDYHTSGSCIGGRKYGAGLYVGSPTSAVRIRIYDKGLQLDTGYHWIRVEVQIRRGQGHLDSAVAECLKRGIADAARGVVGHYLSFVKEIDDTSHARWPLQPWWAAFLQDAPRLKLFVQPPEPDLQQRLDNAARRVGPTLAMVADILGDDAPALLARWLRKTVETARHKLSERHRAVLGAWKCATEIRLRDGDWEPTSRPRVLQLDRGYVPSSGGMWREREWQAGWVLPAGVLTLEHHAALA